MQPATCLALGSRDYMSRDVRDADGVPPRGMFSAYVENRLVHEMLGLVKGVICDGVLNDGELTALKQWMSQHSDICVRYPGNVLAPRLVSAFEDGVIDEEEREELRQLLMDTVGESDDQTGNLTRSGRLPLNRPTPPIVFENREFCLTGIFAYGPRKKCEEEIHRRGGRCVKAPTSATHFVVIGLDASPAWNTTTHGTKIEHAVHLRDDLGRSLAIISEEHWIDAIEAEGSPTR